MKIIVNYFSSILCFLFLFSGILMTGCTDGPLDLVEGTEQENGNKPSEDDQDKPSEGEQDNSSEADDIITYVENSNWTVEFNSPGIVDGYEYDYVVSVTSTFAEYYFISLIDEDYYLESDIDVLAPELYQLYLEVNGLSDGANDSGHTILDFCYNKSAAQFYMLTPGNQYRAVVLGVTKKGTLSGSYAVSEVIIPEEIDSPEEGEDDSITFVENDAWTIEFELKAEVDGYEQSNVLFVNSTDDNYYFISLTYEEDYQATDFKELVDYFYSDLLYMVDFYKQLYGPDYGILDMCYNTSAAESFWLDPGEYRAIVLGITDEGTLSGLYAISDLIIKE